MTLTRTFAVVSLSTMVLLAAVVTWLFDDAMRMQAQRDGEQIAETYVSQGVQSRIDSEATSFWEDPGSVSPALVGSLDTIARANSVQVLDGLSLYSPEGEALWTSRGTPSDAPALDMELAQESEDSLAPQSQVVDGENGPVLEVTVPVIYGDRLSGVYGYAQVDLPWEDTANLLWRSLITVAAVIVVIALLAWLLLFRTVHRASSTLREQAQENERLALSDALTGLPNRRLLQDRLERAIVACERSGKSLALMILDVDRFKEVNDTLGHDRGDALLKEVAQRLSEVVRDADTVARLGGDEFAVLAPDVGSLLDAERLAGRVHSAFDEAFMVGDLHLHVEASIGVAMLPDNAENSTELMQRADTAMYAAKSTHLGALLYRPGTDGNSAERLALLSDLRNALGTQQLSIHYQPKIDLASGHVIGTEALLRWNHPNRGNIPPNDFIPLAENTGLIQGLTRYVLEMVCSQMSEWDRVGAEFAHLPVAINLSARNLLEPDFDEFLEDILASHLIEPNRIELEVTESALIEDPVRSHQMMHKIAGLGVTLAVDDFGTGYTSMSQLEQMPLSTLKIDRSFTARLADDPGGATLVKAMVDLAHEFGLEVVAEGVEDAEVTARLRELGCDIGQGFLWSRPVASDALPEVLFQLSFRRRSAVGTTAPR
ncbi:MAG: putative bifunctional diguanylate cyclase/phosphodiesterase [Actinomycetes bacterium]